MVEFAVRALLAGCGLAAFMGPLGSFIVWRRMAYFGNALAHAALLGVALGFLLGADPSLGIAVVCVAAALTLIVLRRRGRLSDDTLLGILAESSLALGLIAIAFLETVRVDLMAYLFGDVLAVSDADLVWIFGGGAIATAVLAALWRPLIAATVHEDLARVEGVRVVPLEVALMLLIALTIAIGMKLVGILLVTALLIIPAATARRLARTPEQMAVLASAIGTLDVALGLAASLAWDLPSGPAIVAAAAGVFVLGLIAGARRARRP